MRILADDARAFFAHPSQCVYDLDPANLHDNGLIYYAQGNVCGVFNGPQVPGVYFGHYAVKPEGWGKSDDDALAVLNAFARDAGARAIVGWTDTGNRAALFFAKRLGFENRGEVIPGITEQVWRPKWV